jgi:hypothetical protein
MKSYELMKEQFNTKVQEVLLRNHSVETVEELPDGRRQEVQFIFALMASIDSYTIAKMGHEELPVIKAKVLAAIMYIIANVVEDAYLLRPATNSDLFKILYEAIGISKKNPLDALTKRQMMEYAEKFLSSQIIQGGNLVKGTGLFLKHELLDIPGFDLFNIIERLSIIREKASKEFWAEQFNKRNEALKAATTAAGEEASLLVTAVGSVSSGLSGLLGFFGGKAPAPTPAPLVDPSLSANANT